MAARDSAGKGRKTGRTEPRPGQRSAAALNRAGYPDMVVRNARDLDRKTDEAARVLFLLVEVARKNFRSDRERRERVTRAFLALAGREYATERDAELVRREFEGGTDK